MTNTVNGITDPVWPVQRGEEHADVAIVGGGLTGVTAALLLTSLGVRVVLAEKRRLGCGTSWACLGQLRPPEDEVLSLAARRAGGDAAQTWARLAQWSISGISEMIARYQLSCGLVRFSDGSLALSPMDYLLSMAQLASSMGCRIYENSPVRQVSEHTLSLPQGTVHAAVILLATGSPVGCKRLSPLALLSPHMYEMRELVGSVSQQALSTPLPSCLDVRLTEHGMLLRCDLGRTGAPHRRRREALAQDLRMHFPGLTTVDGCYRQEILSRDGLPVIGPLRRGSSLWAATGYSGSGLTGAFLAAQLLTGRVLGSPLAEEALFLPDRAYPGHLRTQLEGCLALAASYAASLTSLGAPRCPHMGCRLHFNRTTHLWECPCHGSLFGPSGELSAAPASSRARIPRR